MREATKRAVLAGAFATLALLALELGLRTLVAPSRRSAGLLFGSRLPPLRLVPREPPVRPHRVEQPGRVRRDDLGGNFREDPIIGYAPREHTTSTNGWWQSNDLGARARQDTARTVTPGTTRVLVFGDSFAAGSRVPQEAAWPAVMQATHPALEVVSLGVDGYSTAQSLLRYRTLRDRVDHDVVLLTVSPRADLWRDINTLRALAGWQSYTVMPRFVLEEGRLRLVPGPYDPPDAIYADNRDANSARLREHLRRYDRFYVPWMYAEVPGPLAGSVLGRFVLARWHQTLLRRIHRQALEPDAEAVQVTAAIARTMRDEVRARGVRFLLVVLPGELDVGHLRRSAAYRAQWDAIAAALAAGGVPSIALADDLIAAPAEELDRGFDGTHHGPRTNALIAAAVGRAVSALAAAP